MPINQIAGIVKERLVLENGIVCPLVEKSNPRCASHMTFRNISQMFAHCAGEFNSCPIYKEMQAGIRKTENAANCPCEIYRAVS
ncbi:MAG TPA: hypothetical protein PKK48_04880 [Phycisphaerae bacterium]|nr:hypothetical protein [Phycisphaerae bacterium]